MVLILVHFIVLGQGKEARRQSVVQRSYASPVRDLDQFATYSLQQQCHRGRVSDRQMERGLFPEVQLVEQCWVTCYKIIDFLPVS